LKNIITKYSIAQDFQVAATELKFKMFEKISMDTFEELSNGFLNKINELKDKIQKRDDEEQNESENEVSNVQNTIEEVENQNLSFLGMISKSLEDSSIKRNLRKRKPVSYYHCHEKRKAVDLKSSWKKSASENRVPVMRNSNDHYVLMDFSHNGKKCTRKRGTI